MTAINFRSSNPGIFPTSFPLHHVGMALNIQLLGRRECHYGRLLLKLPYCSHKRSYRPLWETTHLQTTLILWSLIKRALDSSPQPPFCPSPQPSHANSCSSLSHHGAYESADESTHHAAGLARARWVLVTLALCVIITSLLVAVVNH